MMATELPKERSDEATVTSEPEPTIKIDDALHNVDSDPPHVNGDAASSVALDEIENKQISDILDDLVHSSEVSISGGSDNEASKAGSRHNDDDKLHGRTSSTVKKPASFKAINVNKTFLTTKGAAPNAPPKPSDKAATTPGSAASQGGTLAAARPRLIAKTGSGLVTKSSSGANAGNSAAPDPNAVWNKNRPVPPPEPKKYTDEELKKYGIHMATRLAPDDTKGQANWADIDDDDEDWAPEAITWQDGTKIELPHSEEHHPPAPEPVVEPVPQPKPQPVATAVKENEIAEKPRSPIPMASPIVKPYVLAHGKGLILKGAQEKPTLVAKPPAPPTPVKSPWAPIPKVDKVSPVIMELPPSHSGPKYGHRDPAMSHSNATPPQIAADDFSRAGWRGGDGHAGGNRELFNSQSGRYEPVQDRRGSLRPDVQHGRQPALLQRSSNDQAPAEPSAAFQSRTSGEQHVPYGRRRGSSNVSGGSGYLQRNLPLPPPELNNIRRESMTGGSDGPASPRNCSPTEIHHGQGWPARASPVISHASPYQQHAQLAGPVPMIQPSVPTVTEDDFELQKRLMRERRELAMKRRLEEEAKEEAEKKERIRLKLEAMGPPPESKSAKKAAALDHTPTHIQLRETSTAQQSASVDEPKGSEKAAASPIESDSGKRQDSLPNEPQPQALPSTEPAEDQPQPQGNTHAHPWPNAAKPPVERFPPATWGSQPPAGTGRPVWGAPNNNRTLGNGTFVADIVTAPPQLPNKFGPGPIAPPNSARTALAQAGAPGGNAARQPPIAPPKQATRPEQVPGPGLSANEREAKQNAWASAVRVNDDAFREILNSQYTERDRRLEKEGRSLTDIQPAIRDTWRPTKVDETGTRTEAAPKQSVQVGTENPWAAASEGKPASSQQAPSAPSAISSEYSQRTQSNGPGRDGSSASSILGSRGSRFFPASRDVRQETGDIRQDTSGESQRPKSPSPPPPDMAGHPAFDGDVTHPQVSLPKPQPRVRLPPSTAAESRPTAPKVSGAPAGPTKSQGPSFSWATTGAYKEGDITPPASRTTSNAQRAPAQKSDSWQAKIDSLLGVRPHETHSMAKPVGVDSVSRRAFEHSDHAATVSFSQFAAPSSGKDGSVVTRDMAEECFEEQEMGSLPLVRLPHQTPDLAWQPSPAPKPLPRRFHAVVSTAEAITFPVDISGAGPVWHVSLPGHENRSITVPFGRTRSNPRRGGGQRGARNLTAPHRQSKPRDPSASYSNDQPSGPSASNPSQSRNVRGNYRGRDNWSRNVTTPIQT
ncbi:hypothetical protein B0T22DRAFT_123079 [Podospora appendiculata]|uniref:Uncharacterized protein n=1 Tax=Podospora appendiculata TaxID=314037 RepID=A0AAE0X739_9PEZI|nr:hypothetical protein B0T22DRAFT_123079 [Podospora appendiculata]